MEIILAALLIALIAYVALTVWRLNRLMADMRKAVAEFEKETDDVMAALDGSRE